MSAKVRTNIVVAILLLMISGCGDKSTSWYVGHCAAGDRSYVLGTLFKEDTYMYKDHLSQLSKKYDLDYAELVNGYEAFKPSDSVAKSCGRTREYEVSKGFSFQRDRAAAAEAQMQACRAEREAKERETRRKLGMQDECGFECELRKEEEKAKALKDKRR